jgi:predicted O-methyltransferase YrrM
MNTVPSLNKYIRRLQAIGYGICYPSLLRKSLQNSIRFMYGEGVLRKSGVKQKLLNEIVDIDRQIKLQNFDVREGNVTYFELMAIAILVANRKPKNLLEIGTFDGNTTLQMALNASEDAVIHTIDLPEGEVNTHLPILDDDVKFVQDQRKRIRKYKGSSIERKVIQHFGDSTAYDFEKFIKFGQLDFCFIDGGHSYECVRSDTEHVLQVIAPKGIILWHDFTPNFPGVYKYLCELSKTRSLIHIADTQLVVLFLD